MNAFSNRQQSATLNFFFSLLGNTAVDIEVKKNFFFFSKSTIAETFSIAIMPALKK